ncbi:MAG: TIGR01459 family HAD-type hydrolase [Pseudomonadota bacterium]|nr:TIGR01459 family HAD-type hydrolase [Pseudomonadota bacterium]
MAASPEATYDGVTAFSGVAALARLYDGFIVDQWGILHDGSTPYPGAIDCLRELRRTGKHIVVLSNSGRRNAENIRLMAHMGFDPSLVDRFVGAGEDAREAIAKRASPFHAGLGRRYFPFTRDDNVSLMEGLDVERVTRLEDADFLMVIGIDSPRLKLADYELQLAAGAARRLPMICANPDIVRPSPEGLLDAPGALAQRYEQLGGPVFYHGKPHAAIYESCLQALSGIPRDKVITVGDSIEHDVLGSIRAGLRSAFVAGGIHVEDLGAPWGTLPQPPAWRHFLDGAIARPDYLVPAFVW